MVATAGRGWRLAPSLIALVAQADARWPNRSRRSDGSIGDAAHRARKSKHNPDASGDVLAVDLTHDPANGCDAHAIAEHLRLTRDRRVATLISNGRICSSTGAYAWKWRTYSGSNPHDKHAHIDIHDTPAAKNDTSPWFPPVIGDSTQEAPDLTPEQAQMLKDVHAAITNPNDPNNPAKRTLDGTSDQRDSLAALIRKVAGKLGVTGV